jgi:hypothetical protein
MKATTIATLQNVLDTLETGTTIASNIRNRKRLQELKTVCQSIRVELNTEAKNNRLQGKIDWYTKQLQKVGNNQATIDSYTNTINSLKAQQV